MRAPILFLAASLLALSHGRVTATKRGPVISTDFADPSLIYVNHTWYAFATGHKGVDTGLNIQVASSQDFSEWTLHNGRDALPKLGAAYGQVWAPDVTMSVRLHVSFTAHIVLTS